MDRRIGCCCTAALSLLAVGCRAPQPNAASERRAALTTDGARVLGFESPSDWTVTGGSATSNDTRIQGQHSLAVTANGWTEILSTSLSSLGTVEATISYKLQLPLAQPNPSWLGATQLYVDVPSRGIWNAYIGQRELTGMPLGSFQTISFQLSDAQLAALGGTYSDLRFKIVLNVPQGAGPYLLDDLRVGPDGSTQPAPTVAEILGFETPVSWTPSAGTRTTSTTRTQAARSLSVTPQGYTTYTSVAFARDRGIVEAAIDIMLPRVQPNAWWYGTAGIQLDCPSHGVSAASLGEKNLTGLALETWHTLYFSLPEATSALLASGCSDLAVRVVLNVPAGAGAHRLDNIRLRAPKELPLTTIAVKQPRLGTPSSVRRSDGAAIELCEQPADPNDPASVAVTYFKCFAASYGLTNPEAEVASSRLKLDAGRNAVLGKKHVTMRQSHGGLPIFGAEAIVHLNSSNAVLSANGKIVPSLALDVQPTLTAAQAESIASAQLTAEETARRAAMQAPSAETVLGIAHPGVIQLPGTEPKLVYQVRRSGYLTLVDARTGDVVVHVDATSSARDRKSYDAEGQGDTSKSKLILSESTTGCPAGAEQEVCDMHTFIGRTFDWYSTTFGRDIRTVNVATIASHANYDDGHCPNAWGFDTMLFCNGMVTQDIVTHEYQHAVFKDLIGGAPPFFVEIWAMEDAYGDIMAALQDDNWIFGDSPPATSGGTCNGNRDLTDPPRCGCVDHMDTFNAADDCHISMGIPSKAAWLMAKGGTFHQIRAEGIGVTKTALLFYHTAETNFTTSIGFHDAAIEYATVCADWARTGHNGFTTEDCRRVNQALAAVGMLGKIEITSPSIGASLPYGGVGMASSSFVATVEDPSDPSCCQDVSWSTNVEGRLNGPQFMLGTPLGARVLYATATFSSGFTATAQIDVNVVNTPPTAAIYSPAAGATIESGVWTQMMGGASDPNQILSSSLITAWSSNSNSDEWFSTTGLSPWVKFGDPGSRTITFTVTDAQGVSRSVTRTITVTTPSGTQPPLAAIMRIQDNVTTAPQDVAITCTPDPADPARMLCYGGTWRMTTLRLTAWETPGAGFTYSWFYDPMGLPQYRTAIGTGPVLDWFVPTHVQFSCGGTFGNIVLQVSNALGATAETWVEMRLADNPC